MEFHSVIQYYSRGVPLQILADFSLEDPELGLDDRDNPKDAELGCDDDRVILKMLNWVEVRTPCWPW